MLAPKRKIHDDSSGTTRSSGTSANGDYPKNGDIYSIGGGGGGGAGGFGGAASDIGSGGPGGGGGGGGASGTITYRSFVYQSYYQVGALGGKGGANADGTAAADGEETMINSEKTNVVFDETSYKDYTFLGWYNGIDNRAAGGAGGTAGTASTSGTYNVAPASISLADNADNSTTISNNGGYFADVTLQGRTLYKDGKWNTLCLPFCVDDFNGTPLQGATVKTLASTTFSDGTLTMNFTEDDLTGIEAGKPYIVKWAEGTDIANPVFTGVTISNATANAETDYVDFVGTYSPVGIYTDDKTNLYLGADNKLYYPTASGFKVNACRGYFQLKQGLTAGEPANGARAFVLNFGDDSNATGILTTNFTNPTNTDNEWYSLDGCRLNGKPTAKGIYINNGRKVVIK